MNIAVIITGDVRECYVKNKILEMFKDYDVFIGSYIIHKKYIESIGKNNYSYLINPETDIRFPDGIIKEHMQQNMLQWLHLDNIINNFEDKLSKYDIILKYRFDYELNDLDFLSKIRVMPNKLYCDSDKIFYSDSLTFINIFKTYYSNLKNYTYCSDRGDNKDKFATSWKSENALRLHLHNIKIPRNNLQNVGNIIRGSYKKVRRDGNKELYVNNVLQGKFTKV
jgi:hypothetical protein